MFSAARDGVLNAHGRPRKANRWIDPAFLTAKELAIRLGIELNTFRRMVAAGELPNGVAITGKKLKMWPLADVEGMKWIINARSRMKKQTPDEEEKDAGND